jgi:hypothetical protein
LALFCWISVENGCKFAFRFVCSSFSRSSRFKVAVSIRLFPYTIWKTTEANFMNFAVRQVYVILASHLSFWLKLGKYNRRFGEKTKRISAHRRRKVKYQFSHAKYRILVNLSFHTRNRRHSLSCVFNLTDFLVRM